MLEPEEGVLVEDLDAALQGVARIIERRADVFDVGGVKVRRLGDDRLLIEIPGANPEDIQLIVPTALLQFCEPLIDEGGNVAVLEAGEVRYEPQSCRPVRDEVGNIVIDSGVDNDGNIVPPGEITYAIWTRTQHDARNDDIVWIPATGEVDGVQLELTGEYLRPNTSVAITGQVIQEPTLFFEFRGEGRHLLEQITERLLTRNYPFATFLDGEPILDTNNQVIAPRVQAVLTGSGTITGLDLETAEDLSRLLNIGAFPTPLRISEQTEVIESNASDRCRSGSRLLVTFDGTVTAAELEDSLREEGFEKPLIHTVNSSPRGGSTFIVFLTELEGAGSAPPAGPAPKSERDLLGEALVQRLGPLLDVDGNVSDEFLEVDSVVC